MNARAAAFLLDGATDDERTDTDDASIDRATASERVFVDAYAGTGGFTRALLARGATRVVAIERSPDVEALADDPRVEAHVGDVLPVVRALVDGGLRADGLVADPARRGLGDDVQALVSLEAARVVLVSCDPLAMGRDVRALVDAGYRVAHVLPVDLFPGTPEIETMVFLTRT
jgi:23S rRNA (uracil1939-C5)-methyltransferase